MTFLLCDVVFAGCKHVSGPREYDGILFYKLYLIVVCIENVVLQLCKTRYDGELVGPFDQNLPCDICLSIIL